MTVINRRTHGAIKVVLLHGRGLAFNGNFLENRAYALRTNQIDETLTVI